MTPEQYLKRAILVKAHGFNGDVVPVIEASNVDALFDEYDQDAIQDAKSEVRSGQFETGLACDWSRHYESHSVAAHMDDGSWIGWTYWYGGGKHGEPEAVEWMNKAYFLQCHEEQKMVTVRTFDKSDEAVIPVKPQATLFTEDPDHGPDFPIENHPIFHTARTGDGEEA